MIQRTLIVLKPDAIQRGITGEVISRFEKAGLKMIGLKMIWPDEKHFHHHYETIGKVKSRHGEEILNASLEYMVKGPVIAAVLEGVEAVELVRKMVGATEPKSSAPGTIRGDYAHMSYGRADSKGISIINILHASGSAEDAEAEILHWFNDDELFEYKTVHESHTF